jgi:hypothetical protein
LPDAGLSLCRAGLEEVAITLSLFPNDCALTDSASVSTIDYYLAGRMMRNGRGAKRKKEEAWASEQPATKLTCLHTAIGSGTDDVLGASYLMPECPETVICLPVFLSASRVLFSSLSLFSIFPPPICHVPLSGLDPTQLSCAILLAKKNGSPSCGFMKHLCSIIRTL